MKGRKHNLSVVKDILRMEGIKQRNPEDFIYDGDFRPGIKTLGKISYLQSMGFRFLAKSEKGKPEPIIL